MFHSIKSFLVPINNKLKIYANFNLDLLWDFVKSQTMDLLILFNFYDPQASEVSIEKQINGQ